MLNVYKTVYKLRDDPFRLVPDHRFSYGHPSYVKAKHYLDYALQRGEGFIAITGAPGTGKTTLINEILSSLDKSRVQVATLSSTQLEGRDLLHMVASSFGLELAEASKSTLLMSLEKFLADLGRRGRTGVLIVDEAQGLSQGAVEELRLLANLQSGARMLLQVFLVGQHQLRDLLRSPGMDQLRQRVIAASHLEPLTLDETVTYVEHRLTRVGWQGDPQISEGALKLIHRFSGGVPRRINLICSRLFLHGGLNQQHQLGAEDARFVIGELQEELLIDSEEQPPHDAVEPPATEGIAAPAEASCAGLPRAVQHDQSATPQAELIDAAAAKSADEPSSLDDASNEDAAGADEVESEVEQLPPTKDIWSEIETLRRELTAASDDFDKAAARPSNSRSKQSKAAPPDRIGEPSVTRKLTTERDSEDRSSSRASDEGSAKGARELRDAADRRRERNADQGRFSPSSGGPAAAASRRAPQPGVDDFDNTDRRDVGPVSGKPAPSSEQGSQNVAPAKQTRKRFMLFAIAAVCVVVTLLFVSKGQHIVYYDRLKELQLIAPDAGESDTISPSVAALDMPAGMNSKPVVEINSVEKQGVIRRDLSVAVESTGTEMATDSANAVAFSSDVDQLGGQRKDVGDENVGEPSGKEPATALTDDAGAVVETASGEGQATLLVATAPVNEPEEPAGTMGVPGGAGFVGNIETEPEPEIDPVSAQDAIADDAADPDPVVWEAAVDAERARLRTEAEQRLAQRELGSTAPSAPNFRPRSAQLPRTVEPPRQAVKNMPAEKSAASSSTGATASLPKTKLALRTPAAAVAPRGSSQVRSTVLAGRWDSQGKPAVLLPSDITLCELEQGTINCWSVPQNVNTKYGKALYKVEAILKDFSAEGSFQLAYRTLVRLEKVGGAQRAEASAVAAEDQGWQVTQEVMNCELVKPDQVLCRDDKGVTRQYMRSAAVEDER